MTGEATLAAAGGRRSPSPSRTSSPRASTKAGCRRGSPTPTPPWPRCASARREKTWTFPACPRSSSSRTRWRPGHG
eukprot:5188925-Pleurochrysis_carterae.AAC.1